MHGHAALIAFAVWGGTGAIAAAWASKRRSPGARGLAYLLVAAAWLGAVLLLVHGTAKGTH